VKSFNIPRQKKIWRNQNDFQCAGNDFVAVEMNLSLMPFGRR